MYNIIIIIMIIYAPSSSRCKSWTRMWSPRRHCTPASRNPSQGLFSFRKKSKSLNQRNRHHVCPRLLFETHWVKDLKPHRLVGGHDVAWLESLQKKSEHFKTKSPRNQTTSETSQKVGTILRRWQHRQTAAMYTEIEARRTFATLIK